VESNKNKIAHLVYEWQGKEILFPENVVYTRYVTDTVEYELPQSEYKILMYVDPIGCINCKLQLNEWKEFMHQIDSAAIGEIPFLFYFQTKNAKEIYYILRQDKFDHPVCIDTDGELNKLNQFPSDIAFQTFLLNKENKVVVIGNPIYNPAVKELYWKQLTGNKTQPEAILTTAVVEEAEIDFGTFDKTETKKVVFTLKNTGENPLVIVDTGTTCSCAVARFDKRPAQPGEELKVEVEMSPNEAGFFSEVISVKCNTTDIIKLYIKGQAQ